MITYSSVRIYIASQASILPNGFYNVVGIYGPLVGTSTDPYHIDRDFNNPVIRVNGLYYYLTYNEADGFRPNLLEVGMMDNMYVPSDSAMAIYYMQPDDSHLISNYDYPLGANIVIDNLDRLYTAYRTVTVSIYDDYAIENYGGIIDNHNIIDVIDADLVLAATNPDNIIIAPVEGNVESLYRFELTLPDTLADVDISLLRKIALYDYNTRNIAVGVDVNSLTYTLGSNKVTFTLVTEIEAPSTYFLYLPSRAFTYSSGPKSSMAMFAYTIKSTQGGGSIYEFYYSPTQTKKLSKVTITFYNLMSITGVSYIGDLQLEKPDGYTENISCTDGAFEAVGNEVRVNLPEEYENFTNEPVTYTLVIPADKIQLQPGVWVANPLRLQIVVIGNSGQLPTENPNYTIEYLPESGDVYGVSYINLFIKFAEGITGSVSLAPGRHYGEIIVSPDALELQQLDYVGNVTAKRDYLDEQNRQTFEFDCRFTQRNNTLSKYIVYIPAELFEITIYDGVTPQTVYNQEYRIIYSIIPSPGSDEGGDSTGSSSFDYKLLTFIGSSDVESSNIARRLGSSDTIIANKLNLTQILVSPCLTVTYLDHENGEAITGKEILALSPGDVMSVNIRATYYNADHVEVSTTSSVDYGYLAGNVSQVDLSSIFPVFRSSGYPSYFRLTFIFNYNQTEIQKEVEIQVLPNFVYNNVCDNLGWRRNLRFDLYTGQQTTSQYGCMFLTNQYDCVLNYTIPGDGEEQQDVTKYIAELVPTTKVRTGNLSGIYNDTFGANQPQGYGLYGENVYLTGNFYLNNGKSLVDISDDILMAVGNIREAQDRLNNLDTSVKATIEALTLRQESFENGLDANIKNYISTNKNAVLKIGLDYSLWSLGNAGIAMINPNATYKFDPISGNYTVDESTVGDGDEYITLQGSKIKFSTYNKKRFNGINYIEVIFTKDRPESWRYENNIYVPYNISGQKIKFYKGYVATLPQYVDSVPVEDTTTEFLKFVAFNISEIVDLSIFTATEETNGDSTSLEFYTFSNYYSATQNSQNNPVYILGADENGNETLVNAAEIVQSDYVYYVPRVTFAGMFKDGKFNADYIDAKNIIAVDISTLTEEPELDESGNPITDEETGEPVMKKVQKYRKNPDFNPTLPIRLDNYPVYKYNEDSPDLTANFAVVSGTTGKITARGADINGALVIGDTYSENSEYLLLTDGNSENYKELADSLGFYIVNRTNTVDKIVAKFGGAVRKNPLEQFTGTVETLELATQKDVPVDNILYEPFKDRSTETGVDELSTWYPPDMYSDMYACMEGSTYETYHMYYKRSHDSTDDTVIEMTDLQFTLGAGKNKSLRATSGEIELGIRANDIPQNGVVDCSYYATIYVTLGVFADGRRVATLDNFSLTTQSATYSHRTYRLDTVREVNIKNNTENSVTYTIGITALASFSCEDSNDNPPNPCKRFDNFVNISVSGYAKLKKNAKFVLGRQEFRTELFGNGLIVGYDPNNYFAVYYKEATESYEKNQMSLDFQSRGWGMKYLDGSIYNWVSGMAMKSYVPILQGKIDNASSDPDHPCYVFSGTSLFYDGRSYISYNGQNAKKPMKYIPYFSDYTNTSGAWFWKRTTDERGKPYNLQITGASSGIDSIEYQGIYDSNHDLYVFSEGATIIIFGERWEEKLGYGFLGNSTAKNGSKLKTIVTATGIGKETGGDHYLKTSGPLYATVSAVYGQTDRITASSTERFTYNGNEVPIYDFIQVLTADDASINQGAFYITVYYCPN